MEFYAKKFEPSLHLARTRKSSVIQVVSSLTKPTKSTKEPRSQEGGPSQHL